MIGVSGQYWISFNLGSLQDVIQEDLLESFVLIEEPGNVVPTFTLVFRTTSDDVIRRFNERNVLRVSMGKDRTTAKVFEFLPLTTLTQKLGLNQKSVEVHGCLNVIGFLQNPVVQATSKQSALEALGSLLKGFFRLDFDPAKSNDSQSWISPGFSARAWAMELWLHANLEGSVPLIALMADKRAVLRSLSALAKADAKWEFRKDLQDPARDLIVLGEPIIHSQTGFSNAWFGYGRSRSLDNLDTSDHSDVGSDTQSFLGSTLMQNPAALEGFDTPGAVNDNVSGSYWSAYQRNMRLLALLQTVTATVSLDAFYYQVAPLDVAHYSQPDLVNPMNPSLEVSAKYLVGKVVRQLKDRNFLTTVELHRMSVESPLVV